LTNHFNQVLKAVLMLRAQSSSVRRDRRQLLLAAAALSLSSSAWAQATYPSRPIRLIVPFAPGGSGSFIARELGERLSRRLATPVIVDNRPGANGNIGAAAVARADPDGHTLLVAASSITLSPSLFANPGYDLDRDLVPVSLAASIPFGLFVNSSVPADNFLAFADWLKSKNGNVAYASTGNGNLTFLSMYLLLQHLGLTATHVPYSGAAPALTDVLRGDPPFMINDLLSTREFVKAGKLKLLAIASERRSAVAPSVPTLAEKAASVALTQADGSASLLPRRRRPTSCNG
jgi:tripartite-type tricarboxylate transporter receptor subunit TctC